MCVPVGKNNSANYCEDKQSELLTINQLYSEQSICNYHLLYTAIPSTSCNVKQPNDHYYLLANSIVRITD